MSGRVKIGLTLPSFVTDPELALAVARTAEASGVDGVFVYDHVFRIADDGTRRPALEAFALLGAVAQVTRSISIGTLVLRASMRPPASTAAAVSTVARLAPGRVIAGIGAGDAESREENESFGLTNGSLEARVLRLEESVLAMRDGGAEVWVGGINAAVRDVAARAADGWNAWGLPVDQFGPWAATALAAAARPSFACSWSGLVVLDESDDEARSRAARLSVSSETIVGGPDTVAAEIRAFAAAGAAWVILGAVDASDPRTARLLGHEVKPRLVASS